MSAGAVYITDFYPLADKRADPAREHAAFDLFIVSSSAEAGILSQPAALDALAAARPRSPACAARFLSIGCAGLFAGILEFERSGAQRARLLLLESPVAYVQATLDHSGLGVGGDGFVAQDTACIVELGRDPEPGALRVAECRLLAREPSLAGTARLASRIRASLLDLRRRLPGTALVSFDNGSEWARRLAQMLATLTGDDELPPVDAWLPTVEVELRHFMTVRPVLDLIAHRQRVRHAPLVITCLGAGGRFGVLALATVDVADVADRAGPAAGAPREPAAPGRVAAGPPLDFGTVTPERGALPPDDAPLAMLYTRKEFYGREDFYFKWTLDLSRI